MVSYIFSSLDIAHFYESGCSSGLLLVNSLYWEYPSCLQTTLASELDHELSHTDPQTSFMHTSTRPTSSDVPPVSLTFPSLHTRAVRGGAAGAARAAPLFRGKIYRYSKSS